jgi:glutathione-regulated potassium-efflux system ancillary protein KefC
MTAIWTQAALWLALALVATLGALWLCLATALSEIATLGLGVAAVESVNAADVPRRDARARAPSPPASIHRHAR